MGEVCLIGGVDLLDGDLDVYMGLVILNLCIILHAEKREGCFVAE